MDQAEVIRANVLTNSGLALARRYGVSSTPSRVVLDGTGTVVYARAGQPDIAAIIKAVGDAVLP